MPTADRWLAEIANLIPGVRRVRIGKISWYEWAPPKSIRKMVR